MNSRQGGDRAESIVEYIDPERALHKAVLQYGVEKLAEQLGLEPQHVRNKVNPTQDRHPLHFSEAIKWASIVETTLPVRAWAHQVHGVFIPLPSPEDISDEKLYETYTELMADIGRFSGEFAADLRDGRISGPELARLEKLMDDFQGVSEQLRKRLRKKAGRA